MSWKDELEALRKKCEGDTWDFQKKMEQFIINEACWCAKVYSIVDSYAKQAKLDGADSFTICYIEPTSVHMEELLTIEDWVEGKEGCEFHVEETRTGGLLTVSITINLCD